METGRDTRIDFNRSIRGYNEHEVRSLEELASQIENMAVEMEKILQDNRELKRRLAGRKKSWLRWKPRWRSGKSKQRWREN